MFIQESTLYSELIICLRNNDFDAIGETKLINGTRPDIYFQYKEMKFVIEVKISKPQYQLEAVAQARKYAQKLNTDNIIVLFFGEEIRKNKIVYNQELYKLVNNSKISILSLTDTWTESLETNFEDYLKKLKFKIDNSEKHVDFNTVVKLINSFVTNLNTVINYANVENIVTEVVDKLDLFSALSEVKDMETASKQVINLASFLLFNQILFYHIFTQKNHKVNLAQLNEITKTAELQKYFDDIQIIDFRAIYKINILGYIPDIKAVILDLNNLILSIKSIRAEQITHDLAGRFFHDLIPHEVRKVLAAFYTHPTAADLLAGLCIDSYNQSVIDPACGSGTLLVAAYKQKEDLYKQLYGLNEQSTMHRNFIENEITGIDLMPFATHISTINLTLQNIEQVTNTVRFATQDSLELANFLTNSNFRKKGFEVRSYNETIQNKLYDISEQKITYYGATNANEEFTERFIIKPFDVVIMNPPYSDREKMPQKMQQKLMENQTINIHCGNLVNLWGYFLVLGDFLLKNDAISASVIPINFARGKASEKIREFIVNNHFIKYIVKPVGDLAFSEGCAFKDILLVTEKRKATKKDFTKIVYFKKSIRQIEYWELKKIIKKIKKAADIEQNPIFDSFNISNKDLIENQNNLMYYLWASSYENYSALKNLLESLKNKKLVPFPENFVREGLHSSPKGVNEMLFITKPFNEKSRIERAFMIYNKETQNEILIEIKKTNMTFNIPKKTVVKGLRTITGIRKMNIKNNYDYVVTEKFDDFDNIILLSKYKNKNHFDWEKVKSQINKKYTNLAIARRCNIYSPNTSILAFYAEEKFIASDALKIIQNITDAEAKIICLFINSILYIAQFIIYKQATTGDYGEIRETDLLDFKIIDYQNINQKEEKKLLAIFDKISETEFPSIAEQVEKRFPQRVELDTAIMTAIGYKQNEINELLPQLYDTIANELKKI